MDAVDAETNALLINNIASVEYRFYEPPLELRQTFFSNGFEIETNLLAQGHIVSFDAKRRGLWYFLINRRDETETERAPQLGTTVTVARQCFTCTRNGSLEPVSWFKSLSPGIQTAQNPSGSSAPNQSPQLQSYPRQDLCATAVPGQQPQAFMDAYSTQTIYESFIHSLLLTISYGFCTRCEAVPLNFQTVLLPAQNLLYGSSDPWNGQQSRWLGTFKCYMISTGSLILTISVTLCPGLAALQDPSSGTDLTGHKILAAPFGAVANEEQRLTYHPAQSNTPYTPGIQTLPLISPADGNLSLWKQACLAVLQLRGVPMAALWDCPWVNLLIPRPKSYDSRFSDPGRKTSQTISIPWPAPLCFLKKIVEPSNTYRFSDTIVIEPEESRDPLREALDWMSSANEREEILLKCRAERSAAGSKDGLSADVRTSKMNAPSPVMMRRPSTAGANAVYPTPPDAVHNPNGITPSMDGNFSSPGHPFSVVADADIDCEPSLDKSLINQHNGEMTEAPDSKPLRSDNSLLSEAENMFEDMGGDMFGDNDITEADFNFFDEQPDMMRMDMSVDSIKDIDTAEASPMKLDEPIPKSMSAVPEIAVFAKPELKHARSSQVDENSQKCSDLETPPAKRGSSPFDPDSVFKRLKATVGQQGQKAGGGSSGTKRNFKAFSRVDFDSNMPMLNKKYEYGGQFDFRQREKNAVKTESVTAPQTDYFKRHGRSKFKSRVRSRRASLTQSVHELGGQFLGQQLPIADDDISDEDDSSVNSDNVATTVPKDPSSPIKSTVKLSLMGDDDASSYITPGREQELAEEMEGQVASEFPRLSLLEGCCMPLLNYFTDPEPLTLDYSLNAEDFITVAQLVAEQAATGSLFIFETPPGTDSSIDGERSGRIKQFSGARNTLQGLRETASSIFGTVASVSLKSLLEVEDGSLAGQINRPQIRPVGVNAEPMKFSNLYQIPSPHVEVRRADSKLSLLPTAITFWENLGLAPSSGNKDISAVCVCPDWPGMKSNAEDFLGRLKSMYETLKMGSFETLLQSDGTEDGVLLYDVSRLSTAPDAAVMGCTSNTLLGGMETLCAKVTNLSLVNTNIVVYFMYSASSPGTIVDACYAFQRFSESYKKAFAMKREVVKNVTVLQLVCLETYSSTTAMVVSSSSDLIRLCMETYDRCTVFGEYNPAPAIWLEQSLPRVIDFKLSAEPSPSVTRENTCVHVAYAQSIDGRWITTAWTDDRGYLQTTTAYCLGKKGEPTILTMSQIITEMWETTVEMISPWNVHCRIVMTKCGPIEEGEIKLWKALAKTEYSANVTLVLMTVDTEPSLQLLPAAVKLSLQSLSLYTTPVSTPQANIVSPEASATPATPARDANMAAAATPGGDSSGDVEMESVLVDIMDQTWGGIVNHRLNTSGPTTNAQPALISGYLIKRTGSRAEDVPAVMEVNLIYTKAPTRTYEPMLREILSYFRGLGTLARTRGVTDKKTDVRPWHVAAAEKTVRALYMLM